MPQDRPTPKDPEILAAIRALQDGAGPEAFEPIYRRFFPSLLHFFRNQTALRNDAEDLAQTALLRAYQNIHQYRFEASFGAWLQQIGENVWKNALRTQAAIKRPRIVDAPELAASPDGEAHTATEPGEAFPDAQPNPEELVLAEERTRKLRAAIEALPPGMRQCTKLRLFGDLRYREISDATGIGLNSVRSQLFEARKRLKPVLDEYFQGAEF